MNPDSRRAVLDAIEAGPHTGMTLPEVNMQTPVGYEVVADTLDALVRHEVLVVKDNPNGPYDLYQLASHHHTPA